MSARNPVVDPVADPVPVEAPIAAARMPGDTACRPGNVHHGRLFRKYLLLILSLVTTALLVSGGISLYFSYQEHRSALASLQHEKAIGAASRIEQYIGQISRHLMFAALPQLDAGDVESRRIEFLKLLRQAPEVTDIAQLDAAGREQMAVSRLGMDVIASGRDRSGEAAFREAKPGQPWYGPVYFRKETEPYMTIAVRAGGNKGAVTVADVNLKFIWDVVSRIKIGDKGKAYVVDASGFLIADPDIGMVLRKTSMAELPHMKASAPGDAWSEPAMMSTDMSGTAVLTSMAPIEPLAWKVFVEQPAAEVYAKLDASILRTVWLLVAGLVISALAALALARGMVRPIRTLDEGARCIGMGNLDQRIVVNTGDELQALAEQFNRMTAQLRESYAGLERKVEERTRQLSQTLEHQTATAEVLQVISSSMADTKPVFDKIMDSCKRLFASDEMGILLIGEDGRLHIGADRSPSGAKLMALYPTALEQSITEQAIRERRVVHAPDVIGEVVTEEQRRSGKLVGTHALLTAPMLWEDGGIGSIYVVRAHPAPFSERDISLLKTFADQAVIAIQNARLFHEIEDKSRQLEISDRHKSEFLANMSHELRTPLNAIIGFSEVLLERLFGELNEKQDDYLKDIHSSGRHLLNLINDILDLSKIEAGRMELDVTSFDAAAALSNAMTLVRERAQRHGIALSLAADPQIGDIRADERKFKQILLNLLSNAVKFTPDGGRVAVRARLVDGALEVVVSDTGIGIAREDQQAVFEEFRQVGRDYTNKQEGTGLGLALARRFVELHGGTITVDSEPGQGSTFTFTIPSQP